VGSYSVEDPQDEEPDTDTLVAAWRGVAWFVVPSPSPGTGGVGALQSITCPSPETCVSVGAYSVVNNPYVPNTQTLSETWDGNTWSVARSPSPGTRGILNSVRCVSAIDCVAVGAYGSAQRRPLVERWNGASWSVVTHTQPGNTSGELASVACTSTARCFAVGWQGTGPDAARSQALIAGIPSSS
jgi:hypothetical protein